MYIGRRGGFGGGKVPYRPFMADFDFLVFFSSEGGSWQAAGVYEGVHFVVIKHVIGEVCLSLMPDCASNCEMDKQVNHCVVEAFGEDFAALLCFSSGGKFCTMFVR